MPKERTEAAKHDRSADYSAALSRSIEIFTSESDGEISSIMSSGLWPIADATGMDRVNVYNLLDFDWGKRFGQVYHWDKSKGGTSAITEEFKILPNHPAVENWIEVCTNGGCINICTDVMTPDESAFLGAFGVKSMLLTPVFINGSFWGAVAFQDHTNERLFDGESKELLVSAARLCAGAFVKAEKAQALKRSKDLTDTLNKMAGLFLSQSGKSFEEMMTSGGKLLADLADIDRFSVFRCYISDGGLHGSQIYRWDRISGGTSTPNSVYTDAAFSETVPTWEELFLKEETVNFPISMMPPREAATFRANGSCSVFAAPVHIDSILWGFVLFEDLYTERFFDADLAETMHSAAYLFTNTLIRAKFQNEVISEKDLTRAVIDAAPVGLIIRDKNLTIFDCNDAVLDMFGGITKEYFMEHYFSFSPEVQPDGSNSLDRIKEYHGRVLNGEEMMFEWMYHSLEGDPIPCELKLTRVEYNNEYMELVYIYDLRSIRKMEQEIAEAAQTQILIDAMPLCCTLIDRNFKILMCNQSSVELFKASSKEAVINDFYNLAPEIQPDGRDSKEAAIEYIGKAYSEGFFHVKWTHRGIGGEIIPCDVTLVRVTYKGEYVVAGYMQDLREVNKLMGEIRSEKERFEKASHWYESLLDAMPFIIAVQDINENFTFINQTIEKSFGVNRRELIGKPCRNLGLDICCTDNCAIACVKRGQKRTHFSHNGNSYQADIKKLNDLDGNPTGYVEVIQDITEMEHLAKQKAEAEAASLAKSSFLANMSHEIRTPMSAIIGMTTIGKNAGNIERKDYAFQKIDESAKHLLSIINDILDISKIEADKLELSPIEFNFQTMVQRVVGIISFRVDERKQKLSVQFDKNIPSCIVGDDQRLSQVILNLLSNAVKFTPEGGEIGLNVSLSGETKEACELRVEVSDNGIGMTPEQQARLFTAFEQAESGISRRFGGTGLGLTISKRIVEMMGGEIWIESELGKGARFIFTVKAARGKNRVSRNDGFDADGSNKETVTFTGKRILVAEDVEINREIIEALLESTGISIDFAENGLQAVEMAISRRYDAVLMDVQMPKMDGLEASRQIRSARPPGSARLPIIAMTANVFKNDIEECLSAGMDDHIGKPLDTDILLEKLRLYLME